MLKKTKKWLLGLMSVLFLVLAITPVVNKSLIETTYADDSDEEKDKDEIKKFISENGGTDLNQIMDKVTSKEVSSERAKTLVYYIGYLLGPGNYVGDVSNYSGVVLDGVNETVVQDGNVNGAFNGPQNLLNHNGDIPAGMTELYDSILGTFIQQGVQGQNTVSAYTGDWRFGVPINLPNNTVPVGNNKIFNYTALERFGYDLPLTTYLGEYDKIQVSSDTRLMANIGAVGKLRVGAEALWEGSKDVVGQVIDFATGNWGTPHRGFAGAVIGTIVDSSDLNVIAQHAWTRPDFAKTVYNAYYASDQEILYRAVNQYYNQKINALKDSNPVLKEIMDASNPPHFDFDTGKFTDKSLKAYNEYQACLVKNGNDKTKCGEEPKLEVLSVEEQFAKWLQSDNVQAQFNRYKELGFDITTTLQAKSNSEMITLWKDEYQSKLKEVLKNNGIDSTGIVVDEETLKSQAWYDASRSWAHWICADSEGNPPASYTDWNTVYADENNNGQEKLTGCAVVRPSVHGALNGTSNGVSDDTRYVRFKEQHTVYGKGILGTIGTAVSAFFTKLTVTLLSYSFTNIISSLHLDMIIQTTIETFRDSIFFPFASMAAILFALSLLFQAISTGQFRVIKLVQLIGIYILSVVALFSSGTLIRLAEEIPNKAELALFGTLSRDDNTVDYCKASSPDDFLGTTVKIRQMQCMVWNITTFKPWLSAQWGANYTDLNEDKMTYSNETKALIGSPEVVLGDTNKPRNWALYQLDKTISGTITENDINTPVNSQSKQMYKLVDMQFGPDNAKGRDTRFASTWAGDNNNRGMILFLAGITSIAMFLVVGGLTIFKIGASLDFALRLMLLPFVTLVGLFRPVKLTEYVGKMWSILVQRMIVTVILSITLYLLNALSTSSVNAVATAVMSAAILISIQMYWKEIVGIIAGSSDAGKAIRENLSYQKLMPKSARQFIDLKVRDIRESIAGGVAGAVVMPGISRQMKKEHGIEVVGNPLVEGFRYGADVASDRGIKVTNRQQAREGFGIFRQYARAYMAGNRATGFDNPSRDMIETYDLMRSNLEEKSARSQITQEEKKALNILNKMNSGHDIDNIDRFNSTGDKKLDRLIKGTLIPNDKLTKDNINDFTKDLVTSINSYKSNKQEDYIPTGLSTDTLNKVATATSAVKGVVNDVDKAINNVNDKINDNLMTNAERKQKSYDDYLHRRYEAEEEKSVDELVNGRLHKSEDENLKGKTPESVAVRDMLFRNGDSSKPSLEVDPMKREAGKGSDENNRGAQINFRYTPEKKRKIMEDYLDIHEDLKITKEDKRTNKFRNRFRKK